MEAGSETGVYGRSSNVGLPSSPTAPTGARTSRQEETGCVGWSSERRKRKRNVGFAVEVSCFFSTSGRGLHPSAVTRGADPSQCAGEVSVVAHMAAGGRNAINGLERLARAASMTMVRREKRVARAFSGPRSKEFGLTHSLFRETRFGRDTSRANRGVVETCRTRDIARWSGEKREGEIERRQRTA